MQRLPGCVPKYLRVTPTPKGKISSVGDGFIRRLARDGTHLFPLLRLLRHPPETLVTTTAEVSGSPRRQSPPEFPRRVGSRLCSLGRCRLLMVVRCHRKGPLAELPLQAASLCRSQCPGHRVLRIPLSYPRIRLGCPRALCSCTTNGSKISNKRSIIAATRSSTSWASDCLGSSILCGRTFAY